MGKRTKERHEYYLVHREEALAYQREYKRTHRKQTAELAKQYQKRHPETVAAYQRKYGQTHREKLLEYIREYNKRNPELRSLYKNRRRARISGNGGSYTVAEWKSLCEKYNYVCLRCGKHKSLTVDHIVPVTLGGTNSIDNIQPLCSSCNSMKHTDIVDYRTQTAPLWTGKDE